MSTLTIPRTWDDVTPEWMTAVLARCYPDARVAEVACVLRDDGTNRRARFRLTYESGTGPESVFIKAESDVPGRREIHARNGNLFNEPRLFDCGVNLPVEHARAYAAVIDEANLDYVVVMEDLLARGADPRDATRPLTVNQVVDGVHGLARLHSAYWNRVEHHSSLDWVQPFLPTEGWLKPLRAGVGKGMEAAGDAVPDGVRRRPADALVGTVWAGAIGALTTGPQTLLHGDPHVGNTYLLPSGVVGFLDWQVVRRGNWAHDIGYFMQGALTEADRRRHEVEILEEYRSALEVPDDARPSAEDTRLRYRASAAHGLIVWLVTLLSDVHARDRALALVRRYAAAFDELDTPEAVERLDSKGGHDAR